MSLSRDEWGDIVAAQKREKAEAHRPQLEMLRRAAVSAEALTGDEHWDRNLSYIQAAIEDTESQRDGFQAIVNDPRTVNGDEMMAAKMAMVECAARIEAFKACLSLPSDLMAMGDQAKELLERMPKIENERAESQE